MECDIYVIGLGPGTKEYLTLDAWNKLRQAARVFLRTGIHPIVPWLREKGILFKTFDHYYDEAADFSQVYLRIVETLLEEAERGPLVYAVPGHPLVAETSVELLLSKAVPVGKTVHIVPCVSFLDVLSAALNIDPANGLHILDGLQLDTQRPVPDVANIITQVYSRIIASDVKLSLFQYYPDEHLIKVVKAAGVPGEERIEEIPLYELDRLDWIDHLTSVYVPPCSKADIISSCLYPLDPITSVMAALRAENGCPWDREQNHHSLGTYMLEEVYEVLEAVNEGDMNKLCEELGDLLLQIVFHAQISLEHNGFDMNDIIAVITEKMIRRHPHVFSTVLVKDSAEVLVNWEKIKKEERKGKESKSKLDGIPKGLPALARAAKVQSKAALVGFDWPDCSGALLKVDEELIELKEAISLSNSVQIQGELGDLFFAVVNVARLLKVDSEAALIATVEKFCKRFKYIEEMVKTSDKEWRQFTLKELDNWWNEAKKLGM
jgi:tetrapyrrole methylase family protein/MazG family protein